MYRGHYLHHSSSTRTRVFDDLAVIIEMTHARLAPGDGNEHRGGGESFLHFLFYTDTSVRDIADADHRQYGSAKQKACLFSYVQYSTPLQLRLTSAHPYDALRGSFLSMSTFHTYKRINFSHISLGHYACHIVNERNRPVTRHEGI